MKAVFLREGCLYWELEICNNKLKNNSGKKKGGDDGCEEEDDD